jgi:hypothetical protein
MKMKLLNILCFTLLCAGVASAGIVVYEGKDAGVGPGNPRPNSDVAAAAFDAAAGALGTVNVIDFEGLTTGQFTSKSIFPGVTASQFGYDAAYLNGGISQDTSDSTPTVLGYNTTVGGDTHWRFAPEVNIGSASAVYDFDTPIQAFGLYLTGLEPDISGDLFIEFSNGAVQALPVTGSLGGGVQFYGFTDVTKSINSVTMALEGVIGSRELYGMDDVRFVSIPEPASIGLLGLVSGGIFFTRRIFMV